jgi:hypothetical protein
MTITIRGTEYTEADVPSDLAQDAIAVQDACNIGGVINLLHQVKEKLHAHPRYKGTDWVKHHPLIVLLLSKCGSLCTGDGGDVGVFSLAYDQCETVAEAQEVAA